ncbi:MAG TPA: hypothetical protein VJM34_05405 [Novosphingobium sp.]|nr:hypothetical protein [Novosphingobium sp.]
MTITAEHELWAVKKHHGANAEQYIAEQVKRLADQDDRAGVAMWLRVADRYDALRVGAHA